MVGNTSVENLKKVKHIVVLMMENRSFDQMLGFLKLEDRVKDVEGLSGEEINYDEQGEGHKVFPWDADKTSFHLPDDTNGKLLDPCHGPNCVEKQLEPFHGQHPGGFVRNFLATRRDAEGNRTTIPAEYHDLPMGYYTQHHLPVYDLLARKYCVCDAWHSSIPGDTWPNRLYAMAGEEADPVLHRPGFLHTLIKRLKVIPPIGKLEGVPLYEVAAFTRQLSPGQWRWYSHDPATLRGADKTYRRFPHTDRENFAYFSRKSISLKTKAAEAAIVELHDGFLDHAAKVGGLRQVSWIDPNFVDVKILDPNSNDDHPPSDVRAGQQLVLETYEALVNSPEWADTVLVVVYDEHGGFYDHVDPPAIPAGDPSKYGTLGLRVPAIVIGPRVKNFVHSETLEHTTLISTILRAFAEDGELAVSNMPTRVRHAPHLGALLEADPRPEMLDVKALQEEIDEVRARLDEWHAMIRLARRAREGKPSEVTDGGAGRPQPLHDWQEDFLSFALAMREAGLPPGQT
ncbi:MAG TPA: alkaline phosphatase family protein [Solirubrobacterales bacterium]|nr:alkaline phosphatase family protein [Solirubrobacterales bacterium]